MKKFLGHAITNGRINYLSVSSMELYTMAPRRWYARYRLGFKDTPQQEGIDYHEEAAKYLQGKLTKEQASPVLRKGLYLLPEPGPDLLIEQEVDGLLTFGGIKLTGAIDLVNPRGGSYAPGRPPDPPGTVEVADHKFRERLANAPHPAELLGGIQMPGYGRWVLAKFPDTRYVRLSHNTFSKDSKEGAEKAPTTLVPVEKLVARTLELDRLALEMAQVAAESNVEKVPCKPGRNTCKAYGRICPYAAKCSLCPAEFKPEKKMSEVVMTPEELAAFDNFFPETPKTRMVIQDETEKPLPAGRAEQGRLYRLPDKTSRRFLTQTDGKMSFLLKGETPVLLDPSTLIERVPETDESWQAALKELGSTLEDWKSRQKGGHVGVLPSDAPKSQMVPGMAFAAEDGSLATQKRKRKAKLPADGVTDATAARKAVLSGELSPAEYKLATAVKPLEDMQSSASDSAPDSEKDADEKLQPVVEALRGTAPAEEATNAFLASAEVFVDQLLKRLEGRAVTITIKLT